MKLTTRVLRYSVCCLVILMSQTAFPAVLRTIDADKLITSNHLDTLTLPTVTDTLVALSASQTLTNKTISGGSNTLSQLPVAVQMDQYTVTPYPNGSATTFTLSPVPVTSLSVQLYLDGTLLRQGSGLDYTISGVTITMTTAPATGQVLWAVYSQY